jgi:hypothetical protein
MAEARAPLLSLVALTATLGGACEQERVFPFPEGIYDVAQTVDENTCAAEMPAFREERLGVFVEPAEASPPSPAPLFVDLGYSIAWREFVEQDESIVLNGTVNCADGSIGTHETTSTLSGIASDALTVHTTTMFDGAATCEPVVAGCNVTATYALRLAEACDDGQEPNGIIDPDWQCVLEA